MTDRSIAAAYILVAGLAWLALCRAQRNGGGVGIRVLFWKLTIALLVVLCLDALVGLGGFLAMFGRQSAKLDGWYSERRPYQVIASMAVTGACFGGAGWLSWKYRELSLSYRWAIFGTSYLLWLAMLHTISLHHVDAVFAFHLGLVGAYWFMVNAGIVCVGLAALCSERAWRKGLGA